MLTDSRFYKKLRIRKRKMLKLNRLGRPRLRLIRRKS